MMGADAGKLGPVLVTGAAQGLGAAIAIALAERGIEPILLGRSAPSLQATVHSVSGLIDCPVRCVVADVSNWDALQSAITGALINTERLHGIVNNAGVIDPIARVEDSDPAVWARCIQVNLVGAYNVMRACLRYMTEGGVIANISSGAAVAEHAGWSAYAASKAALERLSATLANERPDLHVVAVRPGRTATHMQEKIRESGVKNAISMLPLEALQPPAVAARAIARLFGHSYPVARERVIDAQLITSPFSSETTVDTVLS
jgi:3-oxoacyl-[acyl-carrier protein] reductase